MIEIGEFYSLLSSSTTMSLFAPSLRIIPRLLPRAPLNSVRQSVRSFASKPSISSFTPRIASAFSGARSSAARQATTAASASDGSAVDWTAISKRFAVAAGGAMVLHYTLNRETRGALSPTESDYLHSTFMWTGAGLAITGAVIKLLHSTGGATRLMTLNPWVFAGVGLVASIGSMYGVFYTAPDTAAHYACWAAFSALQGATLSPMFFLNPAILSRAALYTAGAMGGLTYVGVTAQNDTFLYLGGALMAGLGVVIVTSLLPMLMPRMAVGTLSALEHVGAYGGVAVFSGLILYDTSKVLNHARMVERGQMIADPVRESVSIILDVINLFVKIVQVLLLQQRKK